MAEFKGLNIIRKFISNEHNLNYENVKFENHQIMEGYCPNICCYDCHLNLCSDLNHEYDAGEQYNNNIFEDVAIYSIDYDFDDHTIYIVECYDIESQQKYIINFDFDQNRNQNQYNIIHYTVTKL